MKKLSQIVADARRIAGGNGRNYPAAATKALTGAGYRLAIIHTQTLRCTYGIDIPGLDEKLTLHSAVCTVLGQDGGRKSARHRSTVESHKPSANQFQFAF